LPTHTENRNQKLVEYVRRPNIFGDSYSIDDDVDRKSWRTKERVPAPYFVSANPPQHQFDREMEKVEEEIRSSRYIIGLQNDYQEEDFVPYAETTWKRAIGFFRRMAIHAISCRFFDVKLPIVGPAGNGSIDIFWELPDRTLLINFPAGDVPATYYGVKPGSEISGRIDPNFARPELILWLADSTK
jgi:hypothetical protein